MSFGASGCCMHPFIQEETDNIVLQINRFSPYVTGQRTKIHISQPGMWCGQMWKRRPFPAARPEEAPHVRPHVPGTCWTRFPTVPVSRLGIGGVATAVGYGSCPRMTWAATRR